eukprot:15321328-Heterocapsa_arctica.AAC.1
METTCAVTTRRRSCARGSVNGAGDCSPRRSREERPDVRRHHGVWPVECAKTLCRESAVQ